MNNNQLDRLSTPQLLQVVKSLTEKEKFRLARTDYSLFLELILKNATPPYVHSAHTRLLCQKLSEVSSGKCKRLIVCMPPRHSKSQTISRFYTSWYFGNHPDHNVLIASYGSTIAENDFSMPARNVIEMYGKDIFNVTLDPKKHSLDHWKLANHAGNFYAVGIGSATTGKGFNLAIIDDPIKDWKEANSPTVKDGVYDWYKTVLRTRSVPMAEGGAIILILTRWSETDLAGCLLRDAEESGEHWDTLVLKAICDDPATDPLHRQLGEVLWPEKFPLNEILSVRGVQGVMKFESLYQQNPTPLKGFMFSKSWLRFYREEDLQFSSSDNTFYFKGYDPVVTRIISSDPSIGIKSANDPSCLIVADITKGKNILIRKIYRKRMNIPDQIRLIISIAGIWKPNRFLIEDVGFQRALKEVSLELDSFIPFVLIKKGGRGAMSKIERISEISPFFESGKIWLIEGTSDTNDFVEEYEIFPSSSHDDQLDTLEQIVTQVYLMPSFGKMLENGQSQSFSSQFSEFLNIPNSASRENTFTFDATTPSQYSNYSQYAPNSGVSLNVDSDGYFQF